MTDQSDLVSLLAVQDLDLAIDQHRHLRNHLPERLELQEVEARRSVLAQELSSVVASRDEVAGRQAEVETELAATEGRMAAVNRRLYSGEVTASRELQAMADDVEALKSRASNLEDQVLELLEQREPRDEQSAKLSAELEELTARGAGLRDRLADAEVVVDAETAALLSKRADAMTEVPPNLVSTYERLRARLGGVGVARVVGNHCDGCHLTLSAVELDHLRHLPPGEVATCEQCSRILVP
jgi:predicted  nucleic acid-binding Zn-ribbon protein